jgi:hypothetical protein
MKRIHHEMVQAWVPAPPKWIAPVLILISHPDGGWTVANLGEIDAMADRTSMLGRLLRGHAAMMSLPYLSNE